MGRYELIIDGETLTIRFHGASESTVDYFNSIKDELSARLRYIFANFAITQVILCGDKFGKAIARLARYELRELLENRSDNQYAVEVTDCELTLIGNSLFAKDCCGDLIDGGLTIRVEDALPDSDIVIYRETDGAVYQGRISGGIHRVDPEFIKEGTYIIFIGKDGLTSNSIKAEVRRGGKGLVFSFVNDEQTLLYEVSCLAKELNKLNKRVSDHIDGCDVI